jgi:hypothetical protein
MRTSRSVRLHRTLHLVDADNLLGDPTTVDRPFIIATFDEYRRVAGYTDGDHVVVATGVNGWHVLEVEAAWPSACHRRRSGRDGADLALLDDADWAASCGRFDRVVIGSGDRIFIVAFEQLVAAGVGVEVVACPRALSLALAVQANGLVRYLHAAASPRPAGRRASSRGRRRRACRGDDAAGVASTLTAPSHHRPA